ncbi:MULTISPECIES: glycosyltransferase family 2 protein [Pseudomonas]|uniref:glycosyltransferase family 2 protein n=1 Tax=Pseudomonas TaxID=286 RepID=UPI00257F4F29|nr:MULTISPECIES: glycosyltransferase family 2 protein [Pseudomonas]
MSSGEISPLVSVIVPCYNYSAYVGQALLSILAQDYPNFELIIVDDGSTDDSVVVIERAIAGCESWSLVRRVRFFCQSNQGVSAALNAGLAYAEGAFIATFDADDLMPPGRIYLQVNYLLAHPSVGCLGGKTIPIDERGNMLPTNMKRKSVLRFNFSEALAVALCVGGNVAMYRSDAMERVGNYDPEIKVQDFQMTLKIAYAGYGVAILPEVVTFYRQHGCSLSKDYKTEYQYNLKVIEPYSAHLSYESAWARVITKALHNAVIYDKRYAWELFRQVPLRQWDKKLLRRLRHFLFKAQKPWPFGVLN